MESINRIAGFKFSFVGGFTGIANPEANVLFSDTAVFNYRHELTYIVVGLPSDSVNCMMREGVATSYGGMRDKSFEDIKREFSVKYYPLKSDDLEKIFERQGFIDFYLFSALTVEQILRSKESTD